MKRETCPVCRENGVEECWFETQQVCSDCYFKLKEGIKPINYNKVVRKVI